jgi:hypothetical protein
LLVDGQFERLCIPDVDAAKAFDFKRVDFPRPEALGLTVC